MLLYGIVCAVTPDANRRADSRKAVPAVFLEDLLRDIFTSLLYCMQIVKEGKFGKERERRREMKEGLSSRSHVRVKTQGDLLRASCLSLHCTAQAQLRPNRTKFLEPISTRFWIIRPDRSISGRKQHETAGQFTRDLLPTVYTQGRCLG